MRTALLFALIFTGVNAPAQELGPVSTNRQPIPVRNRVVRTSAMRVAGTAVVPSARTVRDVTPPGNVTTVEGVLPRVVTSGDPAQMINPFAPPQYGSSRNFVVYTERDPFRTDNENKNRFQPDGIRLLTIRPLW